jgi:hypothetical protein
MYLLMGDLSVTSPKRGRALPDTVLRLGGVTPSLSPALFSTQLLAFVKSSEKSAF